MTPYYERDGIQIYHGDCREILPTLDKVDLVLTDPPYGIDYKSGREGSLDRSIVGDENTDLRDSIFGICENIACFASWKCSPPTPPKGILIWEKPTNGMGDLSFPWGMNYEQIWIYGPGWEGSRAGGAIVRGETVVTWNTGPAKRSHPHQKPVEVISQIIRKSTAQTILDPFMGSGTTLRAAKDLGRQAIGIEIEEKYCEIAANRLAQGVLDFST